MSSINIKRKCPNGENSRATTEKCPTHKHYNVSLTKVYNPPEGPHYKVCKHTRKTVTIRYLRYDGQNLTDEGGNTKLTEKHSGIKEVSTYYSAKYDYGQDYIDKPLLLRIKDEGNNYHWYFNADADDTEEDEQYEEPKEKPNTRWKAIPEGETEFYQGNNPTPTLRIKLNTLACKLHNLHSVNIYEKETYSCACSKTKVSEETDLSGYTKYKHEYDTNANFVRYRKVSLEEDDDGSLTLDDITGDLSVYYWDKDEEHRKKPLVIEVNVGGIKAYYGNNGKHDNAKWSVMESVSPETLHKQKCKLFRPADINVFEQQQYKNTYCESISHDECPENVEVSTYNNLSNLNGYKAVQHTYGGGKFTITGFTKGPFPGNGLDKDFPIWDVAELVVFFASCADPKDPATSKPLLVYVGSNDEKTQIHKWYSRTNEGDTKWKTISNNLDQQPPHDVRDILVTTLDEIKKELGLRCPGEEIPQQPPPPVPLPQALKASQPQGVIIKFNIRPKGNTPETYNGYESIGTGTNLQVKRSPYPTDQGLTSNFYEYEHTLQNGGEFTLKEIQGDGANISAIRNTANVTSVSAYYWKHENDGPRTALIVGVTTGDTTTYYGSKRNGSWIALNNTSHPPLRNNDLERTLDDLLCLNYDAVIMDLSHDASYTVWTAKKPYCCSCHDGNDRKVTVTLEKVSASSQIGYYKHSIKGGDQLAGIKYYLHGSDANKPENRKRIKLNGHPFPIQGPVSVYSFNCGKKPVLIYVDGGSATGWYQKGTLDSDQWVKPRNELNEVPDKIKRCNEDFKKLAEELKRLGCNDYGKCTAPKPQPRSEDDGPGLGSQTEEKEELQKKKLKLAEERVRKREAQIAQKEEQETIQTIAAEAQQTQLPPTLPVALPMTSPRTESSAGSGSGESTGGADTDTTSVGEVEAKVDTFELFKTLGGAAGKVVGSVLGGSVVASALGTVGLGTALGLADKIICPAGLHGDNGKGGAVDGNDPSPDTGDVPDLTAKEDEVSARDEELPKSTQEESVPSVAKSESGAKPGELQVEDPQPQQAEVAALTPGTVTNVDSAESVIERQEEKTAPELVTSPEDNAATCPVSLPGSALVVACDEKGVAAVLALQSGEERSLPGGAANPSQETLLQTLRNDGDGQRLESKIETAEKEKEESEPEGNDQRKSEESDTIVGSSDTGTYGPAPRTTPGDSEPTSDSPTTNAAPSEPPVEAPAALAGPTVAAGSVLWTAFGSTSGTLAGAGGLTGFGWWIYKRSKGDPWAIQSDICAPTNCPLYYYEIEILNCDSQPKIVVGFSHSNYHLNKHPGSEPNSFGYKSEDGTRMNGGSKTETYGSTYGKGDVIGCGIDYIKQCYFCTKNGTLIGEAGSLHHVDNFPTVGLSSSEDSVKFNFTGPFKFNIEEYFKDTLTAERDEIDKINVSDKSLNTVVHLYLLHRGYSKTLEAFKRETGVSLDKQDATDKDEEKEDEMKDVKEKPEFLPSLHISDKVIETLESTLDTRSELLKQILQGDSKAVVKRLMEEFPQVKKTSLSYAMLVTQHFVEMLKSGTDAMEAINWLRDFIQQHVVTSEDSDEFLNDESIKKLLKVPPLVTIIKIFRKRAV
ncbi:hypothetical protein BEWA_038800 [Theileria equi strain WA]|uniref:B30.2/SPRY domain-containing protein n=1 Tax=Theileria equi strain WA TaxID=1537102 RepID=L1LEJ2_THEEQ|nr:hypothetical protein BEWA_038800 [Theileria equi strain WA]EKX73842.1 hypothetical protein BEWA_038800 [Theileria equi strain WA]|eukprot:XP_004833294.1 hypothetical protein BEWA_038800 [Theileria equi strain WA]